MNRTHRGAPSVWLVRHAESEANAGLASDTPGTTAITKKGQDQAVHFAESFKNLCTLRPQFTPQLFVTSPYLRTKQTAYPTFENFPEVPHEEWPVQEFTFLAPGKYSGTTYDEREEAREEWWDRGDPHYHDGEGAESFHDLRARASNLIATLNERSMTHDRIVIFTHGRFMRALAWFQLFDPGPATSLMMGRFLDYDRVTPVPNTTIMPLHLVDHVWTVGPLHAP
jgi:probable phosphoglycerate mutase